MRSMVEGLPQPTKASLSQKSEPNPSTGFAGPPPRAGEDFT